MPYVLSHHYSLQSFPTQSRQISQARTTIAITKIGVCQSLTKNFTDLPKFDFPNNPNCTQNYHLHLAETEIGPKDCNWPESQS